MTNAYVTLLTNADREEFDLWFDCWVRPVWDSSWGTFRQDVIVAAVTVCPQSLKVLIEWVAVIYLYRSCSSRVVVKLFSIGSLIEEMYGIDKASTFIFSSAINACHLLCPVIYKPLIRPFLTHLIILMIPATASAAVKKNEFCWKANERLVNTMDRGKAWRLWTAGGKKVCLLR